MLAASSRLQLGVIVFFVALAISTPARAALPGAYSAQRVSSPHAAAGERFGDSLANVGDVTTDGADDLIVGAPGAQISAGITGRVYLLNGVNGGAVWEASPPRLDPARAGAETAFGTKVALLGDVGACAGSTPCQITAPDGFPEILVTAPNGDLGGSAGADQGIVYVLDGKTGQTMKRIVPCVASGTECVAADGQPVSGKTGFGRSMLVPRGLAPCNPGLGGIGPCPAGLDPRIAPGDLDGGGKPDIVIGAPEFTDNSNDNEFACPAETGLCPGVGKVFVFSGEQITGSSLSDLSTPTQTISFFDQPGSGEPAHFGSALTAIGDVGKCTAEATFNAKCFGASASAGPSNAPDGTPDFLVSASGVDAESNADAGAAFVVDGASGSAIARLDNPDPQAPLASPVAGAPLGDLGGSPLADIVVSTPELGGDQGRAWAYDVDVAAAGGLPLLGTLNDPAATAGAKFGAAIAGIGDVAGDAQAEVAIGRGGAGIGAVHIFSACKQTSLQRIDDPDQQAGSGFGSAIAPMGFLNGDGELDLAIGAGGFDSGGSADQGRVYLMLSDKSVPGPAFAGCNPGAGGGGTGGGTTGGGNPGTNTKPPVTNEPPKNVNQRAKRFIRLQASKRRVRTGKAVKLAGAVRGSRRACTRNQKVGFQRLINGGFYQTFDVAVTDKRGRFVLRTHPDKTYTYRVKLSQTSKCMGALSRTAKVKVRP